MNFITSRRLDREEMKTLLTMMGIGDQYLDELDKLADDSRVGGGAYKAKFFTIRKTPLERLYTITFTVTDGRI